MSNNQTMQVGQHQMRKTEGGWQYLSQGVDGEPDRWCDATSDHGPFSGSGVTALLDELAATKAMATDESELVEVLKHIRGVSSCCDVWDYIDEVVPNLYR